MLTPIRWFGPRTHYGSLGEVFEFGDCACCGCKCQSAVGDVDDSSLEDPTFYAPFLDGARLKIIIGGLPASFSYSLTNPVNGFGEQWVYDVTVTGLDALNGTILQDIPRSQYGCMWGGRAFTNSGLFLTESVDLTVTEDVKYCNGSFVIPSSTTFTSPASIQARVVRKNHANSGSFERNVFRYLSVLFSFGTCFSGAYNAYSPIVADDQYRLDKPLFDNDATIGNSGIGLDCKRLGDVVSGVFTWQERVCFGSPANDETTTASACGMTGGGDVADVTGTVGSYSIEIERL